LALISAWIVFPIVFGVICLGLGLLVEWGDSTRLPRSILIPLGFAALVVVAQFTTAWKFTARATIPVILALAGAGYIRRQAKLKDWLRPGRSAIAASISTFIAYGLSILVTGKPTFAGWIKLDDGSTWLAFSDRLIEAGRTTKGLAPSTYEALLDINFHGLYWGPPYPVGAFAPLGAFARLMRIDAAWILQPYMAVIATCLALSIYRLLSSYLQNRILLSIASAISASSALLFGYALWGGVKEIAIAPFLVLTAWLSVSGPPKYRSVREALPLVVTTGAVIAIAGPAGLIWVAPFLLFAFVLLLINRSWRFSLRITSFFVIGLAGCSVPVIDILLKNPQKLLGLANFASSSNDIGNLWGHLNLAQIAGIWPVGDFRAKPPLLGPTYFLVAVVVVMALLGVVYSFRSKELHLPLYVLAVVAIAGLSSLGNAWISAKALAIASPALLVAAFAGIGWLLRINRSVEVFYAMLLVCGGVVWSDALAYHEAYLAPYEQLRELQLIGEQYAGVSPALMIEYNPYGVRHFLRNLDAEGAGELRRHLIPLNTGLGLAKGAYADVDDFPLTSIEAFKTLVLRRSGTASRPPSNFNPVLIGKYYEVWQRNLQPFRILKHISLGTHDDPVAIPKCNQIQTLAKMAGPSGHLAIVRRDPIVAVPLNDDSLPDTWTRGSLRSDTVIPLQSGSLTRFFKISRSGSYGVWLGGSFKGKVEIRVDNSLIFSGRHQLNWPGNDTPAGHATLGAGTHILEIAYDSSILQPGSGGAPFEMGPVILSTSTADEPVTNVPTAQALTLCGQDLDWVEAIA
jgi:hypothetical protein